MIRKKSGGLTQSHLRFSPRPITASYLVANADFVACHSPAHVDKYDLAADLKPGGIFLLNCPWSAAELDARLPAGLRRGLAAKGARLYAIDAGGIAKGLGLGGRTNTVLQAAFFKLTGLIPLEDAVARMKKANHDTYYKKFGAAVVDMNNAAVDAGIVNLVEVPVPSSWADAADAAKAEPDLPHYVAAIAAPMNRQQGDSLPVSAFVGMEDGSFPPGSSAYEKRGAAAEVPQWLAEKCIQCNRCALVCPHAAIRPALLDAAEAANKPSGFVTLQAVGKGLEPYAYRMQVSPLDCTGCGSCVSVCPAREKALAMRPLQAMRGEDDNWRYAATVADKPVASDKTVKSSQFARPLFEFSGACAGCGETPYIKLLTQLFGPRMYIANASGCSTAFGGSTPSTPYTVGPDGRGPAWAMSLFEDNAEYAFGMLLAAEQVRAGLEDAVRLVAEKGLAAEAADAYLSDVKNPTAASALVAALETATSVDPGLQRAVAAILGNREYLARKSVWAMGGDGWAYDIGYGGLDHVLASGLDINVLVLDTEVYSNTGGQSSKATAPGAVAKFASAGKETGKKDLGRMAMSYGYVYVAQVALGADPEQTLRALREAEAYPGPAIVIAYCPCIEHGIRAGMQNSQAEAKKAVESGYWHLYRYDPTRREAGQNPFQLDSKPPSSSLEDFLAGEGRYASLALRFPERAETLRRMASENARLRLEAYRELRNGGS
ncbi:MAG: pyruvate:ferredoxin (flavodoxin) oxidoreductase [Planctomycetaceae bacterium]|nr:pyruvate:ferredoxin (flavodoxin) oxidoreductase [Planctomycetaceae bacterium]